MARVSQEEIVVNLPAVHPSFHLDVFELVGRSYVRLGTIPGSNTVQEFSVSRRPGEPQSIFFRIVDRLNGGATRLSSPAEIRE